MNEPENRTADLKNLLFIFIYSLSLGLIFDLFFYNNPIGISFPLYILSILIGYFLITYLAKVKVNKQSIFLIFAAGVTASMVFLRSSPLLTTINMFTTVFILLLIAGSSIGYQIIDYRMRNYVLTLFVPFEFIFTLKEAISAIGDNFGFIRNNKTVTQILRGVLISFPILLVLALLLSSADMVFDKHFKDLIDINISFDTFIQIFIIVAVSMGFIGAFYYIFSRERSAFIFPEKETKKPGKISSIEISILLGSINVLFLTFIFIQVTYLFGGVNNITSQGFTYAEYARKGFFELIAVALISFFVIRACDENILNREMEKTTFYRILASLLIIFVELIMVSAFKRLMLYEEAFGFTIMRLYSHFFTVWLGAVFLFLIYKTTIPRRDRTFLLRITILSFLFLIVINIINPDLFIARQNINRYVSTGKIDVDYLNGLSNDATPELIRLLTMKDKKIVNAAGNGLFWRHKSIIGSKSKAKWFSITASGLSTERLLNDKLSELQKF